MSPVSILIIHYPNNATHMCSTLLLYMILYLDIILCWSKVWACMNACMHCASWLGWEPSSYVASYIIGMTSPAADCDIRMSVLSQTRNIAVHARAAAAWMLRQTNTKWYNCRESIVLTVWFVYCCNHTYHIWSACDVVLSTASIITVNYLGKPPNKLYLHVLFTLSFIPWQWPMQFTMESWGRYLTYETHPRYVRA